MSEVVRLTTTAIDSRRMVIRVDEGKGRKDRYVMLSPRLLDILRDYWKATRPKDWLFPGNRPGQPITRFAVEFVCRQTSTSRSHRIRYGTPSPSTCWRLARTYAPSSCCSAIAVSPLRRGICALPPARSAPQPAHWIHYTTSLPQHRVPFPPDDPTAWAARGPKWRMSSAATVMAIASAMARRCLPHSGVP